MPRPAPTTPIGRYIDDERMTQREFAALIEVGTATAQRYCDGTLQPSPERAAIIEQKTSGKLRVEEVRSDVEWHRRRGKPVAYTVRLPG